MDISANNPYSDILHAMEDQRIIHIMYWMGVLEINTVDTTHLADAYDQMCKPLDELEEGEIKRIYTYEMQGVQPLSDGSLDDGLYFTLDRQHVIAVLNGEIISAIYNKLGQTFMRIGTQDFEYDEFA